ncbi:MAG: hypothetical protein P4L40_00705 [Terracidiphilus sp.]|nr:hypothetical protein [Terracidiphilus sp.]
MCVDRRVEGAAVLSAVLKALSPERLDRLLRYVTEWNTQSKLNLVAQQVRPIVLLFASVISTCQVFA